MTFKIGNGAGTYSRVLNTAVNIDKTTKIEIDNVINLGEILTDILNRFTTVPTLVHKYVSYDLDEIKTQIKGKSDLGHTHTCSEITDLNTVLSSKYALVDHKHTANNITNLNTALNTWYATVDKTTLVENIKNSSGTSLTDILAKKSDDGHIHAIGSITGLTDILANKAAIYHKQDINTVTVTVGTSTETLTKYLASYALKTEVVTQDKLDILTDLVNTKASQTDVNNRALANHQHTTVDITNLSSPNNIGSITSDITLIINTSEFISATLDADSTITIGTPPSTAYCFKFLIVHGGLYNITWDSSIVWLAGKAPILHATTNDLIYFHTVDKGDHWYATSMLGGGSSSGVSIVYNY